MVKDFSSQYNLLYQPTRAWKIVRGHPVYLFIILILLYLHPTHTETFAVTLQKTCNIVDNSKVAKKLKDCCKHWKIFKVLFTVYGTQQSLILRNELFRYTWKYLYNYLCVKFSPHVPFILYISQCNNFIDNRRSHNISTFLWEAYRAKKCRDCYPALRSYRKQKRIARDAQIFKKIKRRTDN